jgi:hypothetical protein
MRARCWSGLLSLVLCLAGCAEIVPADERDDGGAETPDGGRAKYDPFVGELPTLIADARTKQLAGELLDIDVQRPLFEYGKSHPSDPCPWLLLARDSMAREWGGFAGSQYESAIQADVRVIDLPYVLSDLLIVASEYTGVEQQAALDLIVDVWGRAAGQEIDLALVAAEVRGDDAALKNLRDLQAAVIADPSERSPRFRR